MEKVSLKIVIAGRTYPLTIKREEEDAIRNAAERINSNIVKLQSSYAVKDMQDLLAMTTLQIALQKSEAVEQTPPVEIPTYEHELNTLIAKIDAALN
jgi:cell division protein ZapA